MPVRCRSVVNSNVFMAQAPLRMRGYDGCRKPVGRFRIPIFPHAAFRWKGDVGRPVTRRRRYNAQPLTVCRPVGHVVLFGQKLVHLFLTRYVLSNCICSKLRRSCLPFPLRYAGNQDKEQWDKNEIDECGGEHAAANGGANGIHGTGTGTVGHSQRQNAEEKSQ